MRYAKLITTVAVAAALGASACNRQQTTDESVVQDTGAEDRQRQQQQDEAVQLEQRASELEREWNELETRLANETAEATTAVKAEVKEDVANVREAVAELRTTNPENWWERHERVVERTLEDVEQDVKRYARNWNPPEVADEVGTSGANDTWEARRDRLVNRIERRVEAMEDALENVEVRGAQETEVEDTRARVRKLREDGTRLRNASEEDWWEITKERVTEYIDRVDRSIDRLGNERG